MPAPEPDQTSNETPTPNQGSNLQHKPKPQSRIDIGIIIGASGGLNGGGLGWNGGFEQVFDLYDFESAYFNYFGGGGALSGQGKIPKTGISCPITGSATAYLGVASGWSNYTKPEIDNYSGMSTTLAVGVTVPAGLILGGQAFNSKDGKISGLAISIGVGNDKLPFGGSLLENVYSKPLGKVPYHGYRGKRPIPPTAVQTALFVAVVSNALQSYATQGLIPAVSTIIKENAKAWSEEEKRIQGPPAPARP